MDDLTYAARRMSASGTPRTAEGPDLDARFRTLVQSPLRAGILRYLNSQPSDAFDVDSLMQTFGRLRLDVENCVRELADFGVVRMTPGPPPCYTAERPVVPATADISVLILGPTGSGKEVVARMIHELSRRATGKFQAVNCAALPDTLFESEIFGFEKGAFTGAHDRKPGRLEMAADGTLLLDEIGDMSLIAQAKLLRVLEERRFERLGGHKSIAVDFRLISATNRPLDQFVRDTRFREDLYYRVNAFSIRLPSLRERQVDIPVLAQRFLARYCAAQGLPLDSKTFSREALDLLVGYHWPGNIRELESTVSRAALSAPGRAIRASDIEFLHGPVTVPQASGERLPSLAEAERAHIVRVLEAVQ